MSNLTRSFEEEVIEASYNKPVLVDFWAAWCGPCRVIGPVLEKLATEQADRWTLVKVNTEEHPNVASEYGIRGIPAIKLFAEGKVVGEFTGALPESAIKQWLDEYLPSEAKKMLLRAKSLLEEGEYGEALLLLETIHVEEPNNAEANLLLAKMTLFNDPKRAAALAKGGAFVGVQGIQQAEAVQNLALFLEMNPESLPEGEGKRGLEDALVALKQQDAETCVVHLLDILQKNKAYHNEAARRLGVALFNFLGDQHPVTQRFRRSFNMWLY